MKSVLFLCTGNYYRSRFAEELFNHLADADGLSWQATSRALAIERGMANVGPMSRLTVEALGALGIVPTGAIRMPEPCTLTDLESADLVVAVKEAEHRSLLAERHVGWENRVTFWHVHDVEDGSPVDAIRELDRQVRRLTRSLRAAD